MATSTEELIALVTAVYEIERYDDINLKLLSDEVLDRHNNAVLFAIKSRSIKRGGDQNAKLHYAQKALELDQNLPMAYLARGNAWGLLEEHDRELNDYKKIIELDGINYLAYYSIGHLQYRVKEYQQSLKSLNKSIELNQQCFSAYMMRSTVFGILERHLESLDDLNKALELQPDHMFVYNNRASTYEALGLYKKSIDDYKRFLAMTKGVDMSPLVNSEWALKHAKAAVTRLKKLLSDELYIEVDKLVKEIKKILIYDGQYITHYTSLRNAKALILERSNYRLSEGTYLNDPFEGKQLAEFLDFKYSTVGDSFIEKPFIGSFVASDKSDDLTLWRMYGKEQQIEAKGCSLTLDKKKIIEILESHFGSQKNDRFTFFNVAYWNGSSFILPENEENSRKEMLLNDLLNKLKGIINNINKGQKSITNEILNEIAYLFKSAHFKNEHEIRLIIDGVGFNKKLFNYSDDFAPRVYIETLDIVPTLIKLILGPKVDRTEEWIGAFFYSLKEGDQEIEISISPLKFK